MSDWFARDYDTVVNAAAAAHPSVPLFAAGRSFGGQCAPLLPSRDRLAGLISIA